MIEVAKNRRLKRVSTIGTCILIAVVVSVTVGVHAAETQTLKESFRGLYERFGQKAAGKVRILSGPKAVKMRRGAAPGKQWTAASGLYRLKLTIENKAECKIEKLVGVLEKLPASYMSVCAAVSGDGKDGVAVYADLGGAPASGGLGYVDIVPAAGALAAARAMGPALLDTVGAEDEAILKQWTQAVKSDKVSVSARGDMSCKDDIAEYAELYAVCLSARYSHPLGHLQRISRHRCALWTQMLSLPVSASGKTPPAAKVSKAQVAEAKKLGVPVSFTNSIGMTFVLVPSGSFKMGSAEPAEEVRRRCNMPQAQIGWFTDEHPRHEVTLAAFYMSIHEITHGQYAAAKPKRDPRWTNWEIMRCPVDLLAPDKPVVFVSWNDAEAFCKTLNQREAKAGRRYSLPTEAQWEYACRAGGTKPFSFGQTLSTDQANYDGRAAYGDGAKGKARGATVPVGSLPANEWSLHEMHGNVAEWCSDWYAPYAGEAQTNPIGPEKMPLRRDHVIRGGSWRSYPGACRSACRLKGSSHRFRKSYVGFRAVCALPAASKDKK